MSTESTKAFVRAALLSEIAVLLERCSEKQRGTLAIAYPTGLDGLSEDELRAVHALCLRTLRGQKGQTR